MARRVAIVHDWLTDYAGAEKVLEQVLYCYPGADVFSLVNFAPENRCSFMGERAVKTSFLQKMPFIRSSYRSFLPLMPLAIEQFDLSSYDLVVSSSHAVAKGVLTGPDQLHLSICHSPIRYAWDLQHQYLRESGLDRGLSGWAAKWILHKIRIWDLRTANGVNEFIAISRFVARRIDKVYRRNAVVIYPPVDTDRFKMREDKEDFYLTASRMVPYKRVKMIVEAFNGMPGKRLVVIGGGPDLAKVRATAGPNVEVLGYQPAEVLLGHMQRARAFVFAAEEDFGIAPLEAQACGTPVVVFGKGGALETVIGLDQAEPTGVFFHEQTASAIQEAVAQFENLHGQITPWACRNNALRFSVERFRKEFSDFVERAWEDHLANSTLPRA